QFYWYSYYSESAKVEIFVDGTWKTVAASYNPPGPPCVETNFPVTSMSDWSNPDLENFQVQLSIAYSSTDTFGVDQILLIVEHGPTRDEPTDDTSNLGDWTAAGTASVKTAARDGSLIYHAWNEYGNDPCIIKFDHNWNEVDLQKMVTSVTLQFYWYSYYYASAKVEIFVDGTWKTVTSSYDPPGPPCVETNFPITGMSDWWTEADLENFQVRLSMANMNSNTLGVDQIKLLVELEEDFKLDTYRIIPTDEADFDSLGSWGITPNSASISAENQGFPDGLNSQKCLLVDSSSNSVDIYREIEWAGWLKDAEGCRLTLSAFYARYQGQANGHVQLGVEWFYKLSGGTTATQMDWSEKFPIDQSASDDSWVKFHFVSSAWADDWDPYEEEYVKSVKVYIRVDSSSITKAKIDGFRLYSTVGKLTTLTQWREFESDVQLRHIREETDSEGHKRAIARLSVSTAINTGERWSSYGHTYEYIVDYVKFFATPWGATLADDTSVMTAQLAAEDETSIGPLWNSALNAQRAYDVLIGATNSINWFLYGRMIGLPGVCMGLGYNLATGTFKAATLGTPYQDGPGDVTGQNTAQKIANLYARLGSFGSLYLDRFVANVPIEYIYKGINQVDLEIGIEIGWKVVDVSTFPFSVYSGGSTTHYHVFHFNDLNLY
ncbi:MAG: hypothetical protein ACFFD4_37505, partial [Candidatus Odinarchaeota archaeon]